MKKFVLSFILIFALIAPVQAFAASESEPNDSFGTADELIYFQNGKISSATDVDYYKVYPFFSGTYTYQLFVPSDIVDYDLYLYEKVGSSYSLIASSTNGTAQHEYITYNFNSSKEYYFVVKCFQGKYSSYIYTLKRL